MAKRSSWRFWLFLGGAIISCALSAFAIYTIAFVSVEIGWAIAALILGACVLPAVLLGLPYLNSRFYISYDKKGGWKFGEERRQTKRKYKTTEREDYAEWAQ